MNEDHPWAGERAQLCTHMYKDSSWAGERAQLFTNMHIHSPWAGEIAQQLRTDAAFVEDLGSVPITHIITHNWL